MPYVDQDDFLERCSRRLFEADNLLAGYADMTPRVQERERGFVYNSIRGFAGYLKSVADDA
jgi:hypothetical protein